MGCEGEGEVCMCEGEEEVWGVKGRRGVYV